MDLKERWKRIAALRNEKAQLSEERTTLADEIKNLQSVIDGLLESGSSKRDWDKLRAHWERLDDRLTEKKENGREIKKIRERLAGLVKTGEDSDDDGQTSFGERALDKIDRAADELVAAAKQARSESTATMPPKPEA